MDQEKNTRDSYMFDSGAYPIPIWCDSTHLRPIPAVLTRKARIVTVVAAEPNLGARNTKRPTYMTADNK